MISGQISEKKRGDLSMRIAPVKRMKTRTYFIVGFALHLVLSLPSAQAQSPPFVPDERWLKLQLASLQSAEQNLANLQSDKTCRAHEWQGQDAVYGEDCLDNQTDILLNQVKNATALYPNLSKSVFIKTGCIRKTFETEGSWFDRKCVYGRVSDSLEQVRTAIIDVQDRIQGFQPPALTACEKKLDYLQQALNQMNSSNYNDSVKRTQEISQVLSHVLENKNLSGDAK
jgi:hypothetical protein